MLRLSPTDRLFVLTGAGVSAESGIPTFRGSDGLWQGHRIEDVASPVAWQRDPEMVWKFYSWRREVARAARPNPAHQALAELELRWSGRMFLCTQNVDSLHEQAGSQRVVHMHGNLFQSRCERDACQRGPFPDHGAYPTLDQVPRCPCGGRIRPHICWFGEVPFHMEDIFDQLRDCTVFLCVGSSGVVYPAAGFVSAVRGRRGVRAYYVGPDEPANNNSFDQCFNGKAGEVLPGLLSVET